MARVAAPSETPLTPRTHTEAGERLLIVACSARALADSATRARYRCIVVDHYGDLDLGAQRVSLGASGGRCRIRDLVSAARAVPSDSIVYGASLENHPELVASLAKGRELLGSAPDVLRTVRDPVHLTRALTPSGVAFPRTLGPGSEDAADRGSRWLRKQRKSGGGLGIMGWTPGRRLRRGEILQEHVPGVAGSAALVADGERAHLLALTRQLIGDATFGADGFRYCGSLMPFSDRESDLQIVAAQVRRAASALVSACGLRGVFGIDFVVREQVVHVLEVNPRYTASMELLERVHALPLFAWHVAGCRASLPDRLPWPPPRAVACGKAIVFTRRRVTLGDTRPWLSLGARDIPQPYTKVAAGAPVCSIFAEAATLAECEEALRHEGATWRARIEPARERRHAS